MTTIDTCGCGCSSTMAMPETPEPVGGCGCGCGPADSGGPMSKEEEIAELRELLASVNRRLARLEQMRAG